LLICLVVIARELFLGRLSSTCRSFECGKVDALVAMCNGNEVLPATARKYHRTDYDGPGTYDNRESGTNFGQHDHSHNHTHEVEETEEKLRLQKLLRARYDRRSGTYDDRGYTIGIGTFVWEGIIFGHQERGR